MHKRSIAITVLRAFGVYSGVPDAFPPFIIVFATLARHPFLPSLLD